MLRTLLLILMLIYSVALLYKSHTEYVKNVATQKQLVINTTKRNTSKLTVDKLKASIITLNKNNEQLIEINKEL